jgi:hypothetical protein
MDERGLSGSTRNIELPDLEQGGIRDQPAHEPPSRAAGVREGEHSSGAKVGEQVLNVAREANTLGWTRSHLGSGKPRQHTEKSYTEPCAEARQRCRNSIQNG